ncbi:hypothetical protein AXF42_Ash010504 [Apostasia shenzhenica]|uniref:GIL1/IRKI C-terminal domain-containing protein n=1 Tax=Apostasia shenzhenica TaxID=1088818 RepID=A0A2I0A6A4_9ASPA|nr:hypothetical protein AXF42_Ash010504 [Apostasia shenzhenica]
MAASAAHSQARGVQRQEIEAAIAKAVELRAVHAALLQGSNSSPSTIRLPAGASPVLSRFHQFSSAAGDYPVFTPTYEQEPLPGYQFLHTDRSLSENWSLVGLEGEPKGNELVLSDAKSVIRLPLPSNERLDNSAKEHQSNRSSCTNREPVGHSTVIPEILRLSNRRSTTAEIKSVTANNARNLTETNRESSVCTQASVPPRHSKSRGQIFSWLFHKTKKKPKPEMSPNTLESEDMSQLFKDWSIYSLEKLKRELLEANENQDAALAEVAEMKSSLRELQQKLASLETYCEELKKALKQALHGNDKPSSNSSVKTKLISSLPVSHEVMVEGFLQIVSESRLSVKHFCKILINHLDEPLKLSHQINLENKTSKCVLYHLEALINQSLYQDFENCVFQKNGSPKNLDPQQDRFENFSAFVSLRNLSWNEVLKKGTKYHSEDFSRFCDQKMSSIVSILNWSRPWPESLLQSFFVAAKCIWLLHLLAFSFDPALVILRVDEGRSFDPLYMEDVQRRRQQRLEGSAQVKVMVMPGFYVQDKVLRCRVLCKHGEQ